MDEERDYLMKFIFPQIQQACLERGVGFTEIDLRWGITEDQSNDSLAAQICLQEIDRCREYPPYFIGLVAERYGSIISKDALKGYSEEFVHSENFPFNSPAARYNKIQEAVEGHMSITELEFRYAILDSSGVPSSNSAFYFRSENLTEELYKKSLLDRDKFYEEHDSYKFKKLKKVKDSIVQSGTLDPYIYSSIEDLGESIKKKIFDYLDDRFPSNEVRELSSLQRVFRESRLQNYKPLDGFNSQVVDLIRSAFNKPAGQLIGIVGESGVGKSALLSYFTGEKLRSEFGQKLDIVPYFVGAEEGSRTLASWQHHLCERYGLDVSGSEENSWELLAGKLSGGLDARKTVFLIDALDQFDAPQDDVDRFLGLGIPENVVIVFTVTPNIDLVSHSNLEVVSLEKHKVYDFDTRKILLDSFLSSRGKKLPDALVNQVLDSEESYSPLYIKLLVEDLIQNARFESVSERLDTLLAHKGPADLFKHFIDEWDETYKKHCPGWHVSDILGALAYSREGLLEYEVSEYLSVISQTAPSDSSTGKPQLIMSIINAILRPFTLRNDGKDTLMHQSLRDAALERCDEDRVLKGLIEYFRGDLNIDGPANLEGVLIQEKEPTIRQVQELPYLLFKEKDYPKLVRLVCNFSFAMSAFRYGHNVEYFRWLITLSSWKGDRRGLGENSNLPDVIQWTEFLRKLLPYFRQDDSSWGLEKVLLQVACESPEYPEVHRSAESWLTSGKCTWTWLRKKSVHSRSNACVLYAPMDLSEFESIEYDEAGECLAVRSSKSVSRYTIDGERLRENPLPKSQGATEVDVCVAGAHIPKQKTAEAQTSEELRAEGERTREARHARIDQILADARSVFVKESNNRTDFESRLSGALTTQDINTLANDFNGVGLFDYIFKISDGVIAWLDFDEENRSVIYVARLKADGRVDRRELSGHRDEPLELIFIKDDILLSLSNADALVWQVSSGRRYEVDRIKGRELLNSNGNDRFLFVPDRQILLLASIDGLYGYDLKIAFKEDEDLGFCRSAIQVSEHIWASLHEHGVWVVENSIGQQSFKLDVPKYVTGVPGSLSCIFNRFLLVPYGHYLLIYNLEGAVVSIVSARSEIVLANDGKIPGGSKCHISNVFVHKNIVICAIGEEGFLHIKCDDLPPISKVILEGEVTDVIFSENDDFYVKYPDILRLYEGFLVKRRMSRPLVSCESRVGASGAVYFYNSCNIDTVTVGILPKERQLGFREIDLVMTNAQVFRVTELSTSCIACEVDEIDRQAGQYGPRRLLCFDLEGSMEADLPTNFGEPVAMIDGFVLFKGSSGDVVEWSLSDRAVKFNGSLTKFLNLDDASRGRYGKILAPFFGGTSQNLAFALIHNEARLLVNIESENVLLQWPGDLRSAEVLNIFPDGSVAVKLSHGLIFLELVVGRDFPR